jgi:hypothetical protein
VSTPRRFPPPWTIDEMNDVCFIVRDKNGQQLGYFYYEQEPGRRVKSARRRDCPRSVVKSQNNLFSLERQPPRERLAADSRAVVSMLRTRAVPSASAPPSQGTLALAADSTIVTDRTSTPA